MFNLCCGVSSVVKTNIVCDYLVSESQDIQAATFLQTVQPGHLVIGTVFDEATNS